MMEEKEKAWKTVSSKYLFRRPWLTVRCEDMLLPNGNHIPEYYILEYPDWVNTIAITKDGKFVFVRQYRPGLGRTSYELCAGVCDKEDASPLVSAQRELWEETGYGKGNWQEYMVISANPSTHTNLTHCFLATDVEPIDHQHLEDTEDLSVHLLTFEAVKQLLENNEIMQSLNAAPYGNMWLNMRQTLNRNLSRRWNMKKRKPSHTVSTICFIIRTQFHGLCPVF